jgi:hypothetical protein
MENMMRKRRIVIGIVMTVIALPFIAAFAGWLGMTVGANKGQPYIERAVDTAPHHFVARALFAVSDADMIGTSYRGGVLQPIQGTHDTLSRIDVDGSVVNTSDATVTNSVTAWPGTLELSPDARHAYVIESRGPAPANVDRVKNVHKDLKEGRLLMTLDISAGQPKVIRQDDIAIDPTSVAVAPNGEWLVIAARDAEFPITLVVLDHGVPVEVRHPRLTLPAVPPPPPEATEVESLDGVFYLRIAPNGHTIAIHIQSAYLVLGEMIFDEAGHPTDIRIGEAMHVAKCMSVGRWSLDGRYYIVSDTQWGPKPADLLMAGQGNLVSIAVDGLSGKVVSTAPVSLSPEGMEMSRDGSLFVAVNMERTYLPDDFSVWWVPRRHPASLSLVSFDASNGELRTVDGPLAFNAVLPEDAVFDRDANMLAVAVFNDRVARPLDGWIELFAIDRTQGTPKIVPTGKRIRMPRGVHDLAVAY